MAAAFEASRADLDYEQNEFDVNDPMTSVPSVPFRYERVSPKEHPRRSASYGQALWLAAAPLLGSSLVFPRSFDRAVRRLLEHPGDGELPPEHARWYFGSRLSFEVDPARLNTRISDFVRDQRGLRWIGRSFLDAADWSGALKPISTSPIHREMSELVAADLDFHGIKAYRAFMRSIEIGRPVKRNGMTLAGSKEVEGYFRYCVDLIVSVRDHGVVPRRRFGTLDRRRLKHRDARPPSLDSAERDIGVAIDENGEMIRHLGGKHRMAVAQALQMPSIPVELRLVHVGWLAKEMERTGLPAHRALGQALRAMRLPSSAHRESERPYSSVDNGLLAPAAAVPSRKRGASA